LFFLKDALEKLMGKQLSIEQSLLVNCNVAIKIQTKSYLEGNTFALGFLV
jgi:hypothetical protein